MKQAIDADFYYLILKKIYATGSQLECFSLSKKTELPNNNKASRNAFERQKGISFILHKNFFDKLKKKDCIVYTEMIKKLTKMVSTIMILKAL